MAWVVLDTDLAAGEPADTAIRGITDAVRRDQHHDLASQLEAWIDDLRVRAAHGEFLFSVNDYAVLLRRPGSLQTHGPRVRRADPPHPGLSRRRRLRARGAGRAAGLQRVAVPAAPRGRRGGRRGARRRQPLPRPVQRGAAPRAVGPPRVPADRIAIGNGSCDILLAAGEALLEPGAELVYAWPSFSVYPHLAAASGARAIEVPLDDEHRHDLDAMATEITGATRLVIVCNPNNPTSTALPLDEIADFVERVPRHVAVILDEAYVEFSLLQDPEDSVDLLSKHPNLVLLRTFSKIYGLCGLRVGYALCGSEELPDARSTRCASRSSATWPRRPPRRGAQAPGRGHPPRRAQPRRADLAGRRARGARARACAESHANFVWFDVGGDATSPRSSRSSASAACSCAPAARSAARARCASRSARRPRTSASSRRSARCSRCARRWRRRSRRSPCGSTRPACRSCSAAARCCDALGLDVEVRDVDLMLRPEDRAALRGRLRGVARSPRPPSRARC